MPEEPDTSKPASPWLPVTPPQADNVPPVAVRPASASPELEERSQPAFDSRGLTPAKPPVPHVAPRPAVPTPIEADQAEIVPAVTLPDAEETFPTEPVTTEIEVVKANNDDPAPATPQSPYLAAFTPTAAHPSGKLTGDSATASAASTPRPRKLAPSAAALLAAGEIPGLDDEQIFVPTYLPAASEKRESPLANATIEDSPEPAYTPTVPAPLSAQHEDEPATDEPTDASPTEDTMSAVSSEAAPETGTEDGDNGFPTLPPVGGDDAGKGSVWSSTALLVLLGILVMGGIGFAIYSLFFKPADVVLPPQAVMNVPAETTIEPLSFTDPSDFLAAMPTTVGPYALTDYTAMQADVPESIPEGMELPEGVAESVTLTYSDGTDEMVVNAWQSYTVNGAQQVFEGLNVDGTDAEPVIVEGQEVGTQVNVASEAGPTVLWINGTAVFSAMGGGDAVYGFVDNFGL